MKKKLRIVLSSMLITAMLAVTAVFFVTNAAEGNTAIPSTLGEPKITMTTSKAVGATLNFQLDISNAYVDWGDGVPVEGTSTEYSGELKGNTVKIYSTNDIMELWCSEQNLTALDASNSTELQILWCNSNNLTALDVSENTNLESLSCDSNNLISLDVSKNTTLLQLICSSNQLTSLDLSQNLGLTNLECNSNLLTSLDVSNSPDLTDLVCSDNKLESLNVSNNTNISYFDCSFGSLTSLDTSKCTSLSSLYCNNNKLTKLNLPDTQTLEQVWCWENSLTTLDVSENTSLIDLNCYANSLTVLDLSNNTALTHLDCSNNKLTSLDISNSTNLTALWCNENYLKFSTIQQAHSSLTSICYTPQANISIPSSITPGEKVDLSSEYEINGIKTVYTWYDLENNEFTPTKSESGIFTFGEELAGKTLYCSMYNESYPNNLVATDNGYLEEPFMLYTTSVEINKNEQSVTPPSGTVSSSDIEIDNGDTGLAEDAQPSYDIVIRDENGNIIDLNGVKLIVGNIETNKKKSVLEAIERYNKEFDADSDNCALYDISLVDKNGAKVTIENGKIKVRIKYPDNLGRNSEDYTFRLYHQKKDGTIEEIAINCEPNGIWFYADDFSPYALTWEQKSSDSPGTGESGITIYIAIILVLLSTASVVTVLVYKKKFLPSAK